MFRFKIKLSDVDRGVYETLELRVAKHPSESDLFLLTRVIAYALNVQDGIEFTDGIGSPDEPAICVKDLTGVIKVWIDIGNPSPRRIHKASKTAETVRIYGHRDPKIFLDEIKDDEIYHRERIELFTLPSVFLKALAETVSRDNAWELLYNEGELSITVNSATVNGEISAQRLG